MSQPYDVPLFGDPDPPKAQRTLSAKDRDDAANKVVWRRYKGHPRGCQDCFEACRAGTQTVFGRAVFIRAEAGVELPICYEHKALRDEAEALGAPRGGQ